MTKPKTYRCSGEHKWIGENGAKSACRNCNAKGPDCRGSGRSSTWRYLLRAYGVDSYKGRKVRYADYALTKERRGKVGRVVGHSSGYVLIDFQDGRRPGRHHVLWALEWLDDDGNVVVDGKKRSDEINEVWRRFNARV